MPDEWGEGGSSGKIPPGPGLGKCFILGTNDRISFWSLKDGTGDRMIFLYSFAGKAGGPTLNLPGPYLALGGPVFSFIRFVAMYSYSV